MMCVICGARSDSDLCATCEAAAREDEDRRRFIAERETRPLPAPGDHDPIF